MEKDFSNQFMKEMTKETSLLFCRRGKKSKHFI